MNQFTSEKSQSFFFCNSLKENVIQPKLDPEILYFCKQSVFKKLLFINRITGNAIKNLKTKNYVNIFVGLIGFDKLLPDLILL